MIKKLFNKKEPLPNPLTNKEKIFILKGEIEELSRAINQILEEYPPKITIKVPLSDILLNIREENFNIVKKYMELIEKERGIKTKQRDEIKHKLPYTYMESIHYLSKVSDKEDTIALEVNNTNIVKLYHIANRNKSIRKLVLLQNEKGNKIIEIEKLKRNIN